MLLEKDLKRRLILREPLVRALTGRPQSWDYLEGAKDAWGLVKPPGSCRSVRVSQHQAGLERAVMFSACDADNACMSETCRAQVKLQGRPLPRLLSTTPTTPDEPTSMTCCEIFSLPADTAACLVVGYDVGKRAGRLRCPFGSQHDAVAGVLPCRDCAGGPVV